MRRRAMTGIGVVPAKPNKIGATVEQTRRARCRARNRAGIRPGEIHHAHLAPICADMAPRPHVAALRAHAASAIRAPIVVTS